MVMAMITKGIYDSIFQFARSRGIFPKTWSMRMKTAIDLEAVNVTDKVEK